MSSQKSTNMPPGPKLRTVYFGRPFGSPCFSTGEWSFNYDLLDEPGDQVPRGGIVLRDVYHGAYRLASDIGVVGIYVFPTTDARSKGFKAKFLVLGAPDFTQQNPPGPLPFNLVVTPAHDPNQLPNNFAVYNASIAATLKVSWITSEELFGKGSGYLSVTQRIVFTAYDDKPAHEPAGGLKAARLHPIIELQYPQANGGWVESFRVDYRMHFSLDYWWSKKYGRRYNKDSWARDSLHRSLVDLIDPLSFPLPKVGKYASTQNLPGDSPLRNAAGVFADEDDFYIPGLAKGVAHAIFRAAEKPIQDEIVTGGLQPYSSERMWDNVHWWGAGADWAPGSAPGSFHAVHMHWRWALMPLQHPYLPKPIIWDNNVYWIRDLRNPPFAEAKQFVGEGFGGVLVDPRIDKQILRFAIMANDGLPKDIHEHKAPVFGDFFKDIHADTSRKVDIESGADIALYYSVEMKLKDRSTNAKNNRLDEFTGAVCIHGIFFAHEPEPSFAVSTGSVGPEYFNPSKRNKSKPPPIPLKRFPQ